MHGAFVMIMPFPPSFCLLLTHLWNMDVFLILQHPCSVDGSDADLIPLDVVHVILVHPELCAGE